jgi:hypothetical protein
LSLYDPAFSSEGYRSRKNASKIATLAGLRNFKQDFKRGKSLDVKAT